MTELARRILAFVDRAAVGAPPEPFEALALDIHRWQVAHDRVVASLVDRPVTDWTEIPAVPVGVFKDLPVGTVGDREPQVVFRTSGTTSGRRGEHRMRATALYDHNAVRWADRCVPGRPRVVVGLTEDVPDSSLSHMVARLGAASFHVRDGVLDPDGANRRIRDAGEAVFIATTAFALEAWLPDASALPPGSVVMITGGFKGRIHTVDERDLAGWTRDRLRPARLVTEYGMTELSSQLWGTPETRYLPPPWLRVVAVDPVSGAPVRPGERGQLRFYDLCNLDGTLAIETMDEGRVHPDGSVALAGRLTGAPPRGCSLTIEEARGG
ncbi:MAG: acyl-protein synthetase [Myxococcota bacterium]